MEINEILSKVDHTLLSQTSTLDDIRRICDEAMQFNCASVCIPASYVKYAKDYTNGQIPVCTVIGFPNGYSTTEVKCFEAENAVSNGADEIDMVINIGLVKDSRYDEVLDEINCVKKACNGKTLKVIIETCLLSDEEKIRMCEIINNSDADFIKTSTGFSSGGATKDDIRLFSRHIADSKRIKAAGGISSLTDAEEFIKLGADRLGTSRIIRLLKNQQSLSEY